MNLTDTERCKLAMYCYERGVGEKTMAVQIVDLVPGEAGRRLANKYSNDSQAFLRVAEILATTESQTIQKEQCDE